MKMGFHQIARYYYYPGWHEPGTTGELVFNKKAYEALPLDYRRMLDHSTQALNTLVFMEYYTKNAQNLQILRSQFKTKVEFTRLPDAMLKEIKKAAVDVVREESEKSPQAKKVNASYQKFMPLVGEWGEISEGSYFSLLS
jgi:TRAP-type mannitol/chloroaromatic compound transport system substrate-binding protein